MILLSALIFRSSVMIFGKQMVVYQSAVTVTCSLRGIVVIHTCRDHLFRNTSRTDEFCWLSFTLEPRNSRLSFIFCFITVNKRFITTNTAVHIF
ncbi:unnamed protein product [Acanthoscelides obtectus]|uniref:Secreted protein n=1 Tax=Acanthoscelides obtectus TaxID=200917 RepID=A0A9P0KBZ1_ACAOB|nr:unnamed protein product [Acanthoscelides obtectus]CAK1643005.1 hypothetical protein AOBTE_LOCUS13357 [Acanthoscelides obtectus]